MLAASLYSYPDVSMEDKDETVAGLWFSGKAACPACDTSPCRPLDSSLLDAMADNLSVFSGNVVVRVHWGKLEVVSIRIRPSSIEG